MADFDDIKSGFKITFNFRENVYFSDEQLSKTFNYSEDGVLTIRGTVPQWKPGMVGAGWLEIPNYDHDGWMDGCLPLHTAACR